MFSSGPFLLLVCLWTIAAAQGMYEDTANYPRKKQCPASNFGCIYDDLPHAGHTDCTRGGSSVCQAVGADYCGAFIGTPPKRTCCIITKVSGDKPNPDARGCPPSNRGCIFDDYASNTPCAKGGNKLCKEAGLDYCGATFTNPKRRVCCKIANEPSPQPESSTEEVQCPDQLGGCIFSDEPTEDSCTENSNLDCADAGADYCGAEVDGERSCCKINGRKSRGIPTPSARACPAANKGCIFSDDITNSDCTKDGDLDCDNSGADYCGAFYGFPPKRSCCNIGKTVPIIAVPVAIAPVIPIPAPVPAPVPVPVPTYAVPYPNPRVAYPPVNRYNFNNGFNNGLNNMNRFNAANTGFNAAQRGFTGGFNGANAQRFNTGLNANMGNFNAGGNAPMKKRAKRQ